MNISREVLYALECTHAAPAPATLVSGSLMCAWCREAKYIVGVIEYEWAAHCQNCAFKRWAGISKHNAEVFARGHCRHEPSHVVDIEYARNPTATRTAEKFKAWQAGRHNAATG